VTGISRAWFFRFFVSVRVMRFQKQRKESRRAKTAVLAETELMHREFGRARSEIKHDGTKVTAVDIAISEHIMAAIAAGFSGDQFFSEELTPTDEPIPIVSRFCWVLDPIDGTNNYTRVASVIAPSRWRCWNAGFRFMA